MTLMHVDPNELDRFAVQLSQFIISGEELRKSVLSRFAHVQQTWRDDESARFGESLDVTLQHLTRYAEAALAQLPRLREQIEASRAFLSEH